MTKKTNRRAPAQAQDAACVSYSPNLVSQVQSVLAALVDLDFAYESDFGTIHGSDAPDVIKREVLRTLEHRHQERRAVLVRQLEALHRRATMRV